MIENILLDRLYLPSGFCWSRAKGLYMLVQSLRRNGYRADEPLTVSRLTDGTFIILDGCRRVLTLQWLRDNNWPLFKRILPGGVPCIVKTLTQ